MNIMSKKVVLSVSGVLAAGLLVWDYIGNYALCGYQGLGTCVDQLASIEIAISPILPFFVAAIIVSCLRRDVFKSWLAFALPWLAISVVTIALTPDTPAPALGGPGFGIGKGDAALALSVLFVLVSCVIIVWKYLRR